MKLPLGENKLFKHLKRLPNVCVQTDQAKSIIWFIQEKENQMVYLHWSSTSDACDKIQNVGRNEVNEDG